MTFASVLPILIIAVLCNISFSLVPSFGTITADAYRAALTDEDFKITLDSGLPLTGNGFRARFANLSAFPILAANDVQQQFADAYLNPGTAFVRHFHPRSSEVVLVLRGAVRVAFEFEGPNPRSVSNIVRRGEFAVIPTALVHTSICVSRGPCYFVAVFNTADPGIVPVDSSPCSLS